MTVLRNARGNIRSFDAVVAELRELGVYADGWIAFREWTMRQPWYAEALAAAQLRVEHMRAKTDEERDAITKQIAELEREFAELNAHD